MSDHETAAKGQRAERELIETEEAFAKVRQAILNELATTPPGQPDKILKLHMAVQNLTAVKDALMMVVNAGIYAQGAINARDAIAVAGLTRP